MGFLLRILRFCLFTSVAVASCEGDFYTITRLRNGYRSDAFKVPASVCSKSGSECTSFHNKSYSSGKDCRCFCPYKASTFGFHSGSWSCLDNTKVRKQTDCKFRFIEEIDHYPLRVISMGSVHKVVLPSGSCSINFATSRYLTCDGKWSSGLKNSFELFDTTNKKHLSDFTNQWQYNVKIGKATSLEGRIVSLHFNCKIPSQSSCLLFKIVGNVTCPLAFSRPSLKLKPTPAVKRTQLTQQSFSFKSTETIFTKSPVLVSHNSQRGSSLSTGTMAAIVVTVILIIIMAVITGLIIWKKKRGENVLCKDQVTSTAKIFRPSLSSTKENGNGDIHDQIYAEIPEQLIYNQTGTKTDVILAGLCNLGVESLNLRYVPPKQLDEHFIREEAGHDSAIPDGTSPNDEDEHLTPLDSPLYITFENESTATEEEHFNYDNQHKNDVSVGPEEAITDEDGYLVPRDSHIYVTTSNNDEAHNYDNQREIPVLPEKLVTDDDGYLVPKDSHLYIVLGSRDKQSSNTGRS